MKFILVILAIFSLVSCGQSGSSSSGNGAQEEQDRPHLDGYLDTSRVGETELLNVTVNEAVTISNGRITFDRPVSVQNTGHRTTCALSINSGEIWQVRETSNGLELSFPDGTRASLKPVARISGINGSWSWTGTKNGMKVSRRYAILENRLIINQDCES